MSKLIKDDSFVRNTVENDDVISSLTRASIDDSIEIAEYYFDLYDDSFFEFAGSAV